MLICWLENTEWGNIPPLTEHSSFRSSSSLSSKPQNVRPRFDFLLDAEFFRLLEISSLMIFFPENDYFLLDPNYNKTNINEQTTMNHLMKMKYANSKFHSKSWFPLLI